MGVTLSGPLLRYRARDGEALPLYLGDRDRPWVARLWEEVERFDGRRSGELHDHLRRLELPDAPALARAGLQRLLLELLRREVDAPLAPVELRRRVFHAAAGRTGERERVLEEVARELATDAASVERGLYADLPGEQRLRLPLQAPSPQELVRRYNLLLLQGFLRRCERLRVALAGDARAVVRFAKLRGLICEVARPPERPGLLLTLSGPLALFHNTIVYGHAIAAFAPVLAAVGDWSLEAACVVEGERLRLRATSRDPLQGGHAVPRRFDSAVERALFRDFRRLDSPWEMHREVEAVPAGRRLFFPDFTLVRRDRADRPVRLEIVGFWTPAYLEAKRRALADSGLADVVLCVDESLRCAPGAWGRAEVVPYRKRIDPAAVLAALERVHARAPPAAAKWRSTSERA